MSKLIVFLLLLSSTHGWGQLLKPLPYKECTPGWVFVPVGDSVRYQMVLDSVSALVEGRWELAEQGAGACFSPAHAPAKPTEITLTRQGQGVIIVDGKPVTTFQLLLSFNGGLIRFAMVEPDGGNYFMFFPPDRDREGYHYQPKFTKRYSNHLQVCEETLDLNGPRTGLSYVFRRTPK